MVGVRGAVLGAVRADHIRRGGTEQLPAAHPAGRGDRRLRTVRAADRGQHLLFQRGPAARLEAVGGAEQGDRLGGAQQQIGGEPAGGEHPGEVLGAAPSSRSSRRYQGVLPRASETLRKLSSPASGSAESANQASSTGSRVRWMAALRVTPEASASRCRSAATGSA